MVPIRSEFARLALGVALLGCSREPPHVDVAPALRPTPTSPRPLERHLPPTDLRWLARVEPSALVRDAETRRFLEKVFEPERVAEFSALVGATPEETERLWIAGYPLGTLFLGSGRVSAERVESRFLDRALTHTTRVRSSGFPFSTATTSEGPAAFVRLSPTSFAWAEGDPSLAKIVVAFAEGRTRGLPSAVERRVLAHLLDFEKDEHALLCMLGPFEATTRPLAEHAIGFSLACRVRETTLECGARLLGLFEPGDGTLVESALLELAHDLEAARLVRRAPNLRGPVECAPAPELGPLTSCSVLFEASRADLEASLAGWHAKTLGDLARGPGAAPNGSD